MKNALLGFACFAAGGVIPGLLFSAAALLGQPVPRPSAFDDLLMVLYLLGVSVAIAAVGFSIPVAVARSWRFLPARRAVLIAALFGLVAPVASLAFTGVSAGVLAPFFRTAPWLTTIILYGFPGVLLGMSAVIVARAWQVYGAS
jgi:hypothetical protein